MENFPQETTILTGIEEAFCGAMARHGDVRLAWRTATGDMQASALYALQMGTEMLGRKGVRTRISAIQLEVTQLTSVNVANVLNYWWNQVTADPNEIVQHRRVCCRHCYGVDHGYQWTEQEYAAAVIKAINEEKPAPELDGGYGFDGSRGPAPHCPACFGEGIGQMWVADTRYLSERGKALFAGLEKNKYGTKVIMHDKMEALANIARFLGMNQERIRIEDVRKQASGETLEVAERLDELPTEALIERFRELTQPPAKGSGK